MPDPVEYPTPWTVQRYWQLRRGHPSGTSTDAEGELGAKWQVEWGRKTGPGKDEFETAVTTGWASAPTEEETADDDDVD